MLRQVVHGCRQLVSWDVGLSPATSATLVVSWMCRYTYTFLSSETAGDKPEEGGDDVKSSCPLCSGLHTCYNGWYNERPTRESEQISKNQSQFGLHSATRVHEVGIASKRRSARCVEYVPGSCTHRPSHHGSRPRPKYVSEPFGSSVLRQGWWLGWSRNKVAVPEGVAGSPPF